MIVATTATKIAATGAMTIAMIAATTTMTATTTTGAKPVASPGQIQRTNRAGQPMARTAPINQETEQ